MGLKGNKMKFKIIYQGEVLAENIEKEDRFTILEELVKEGKLPKEAEVEFRIQR